MEPAEYATLFAQEEQFWWYRGLHSLVEQTLRQALREGFPGGGAAPARAGGIATGAASDTGGRPIRILDAGCGTGGMTRRLAAFGSVTGLDWSPLALERARRRGPLRWTRGSVERLPFRRDSFDLVISLDVLYHRSVRSDLAALCEFRRCLRPGGALILNLPAFDWLRSSHDAAIHTARRYRRGPLVSLLRQAELVPVRVTHWNALLFPGIVAVRWVRRPGSRTAGSEAPSDVRPAPGPVNRALERILALERRWLARWNLPVGLSILAVARRPDGAN